LSKQMVFDDGKKIDVRLRNTMKKGKAREEKENYSGRLNGEVQDEMASLLVIVPEMERARILKGEGTKKKRG